MTLPPPAGSPLALLFDAPMAPGRLAWIGLRPARRAPMRVVEDAALVPGGGLDGDRWRGAATGARQATLVAAEHLAALACYLGLEAVAPERLRRNLVVAGINLLALKAGASASARRCWSTAGNATPVPAWRRNSAPAATTPSAAMAASRPGCWRARRSAWATPLRGHDPRRGRRGGMPGSALAPAAGCAFIRPRIRGSVSILRLIHAFGRSRPPAIR
jgi:hypothetical protein